MIEFTVTFQSTQDGVEFKVVTKPAAATESEVIAAQKFKDFVATFNPCEDKQVLSDWEEQKPQMN